MYYHGSTMTAHDWLQVIASAGEYVFAGLFPDNPRREMALNRMVLCVQKILVLTSDADAV